MIKEFRPTKLGFSKVDVDRFGDAFPKFYEDLFIRKEISGSILEIGIADGNSLLFWKQLGIFDTIVGIDIHLPDPIEGTQMYLLSQNDIDGLEALAVNFGGFDVVVDDGSHNVKDIVNSFSVLWKHTRKLYIIEDWDWTCTKDAKPFIPWMTELFENRFYGAKKIEFLSDGIAGTSGITYILLEKKW